MFLKLKECEIIIHNERAHHISENMDTKLLTPTHILGKITGVKEGRKTTWPTI